MSFEGSIGEIDLLQRLVELGREHFTGAIRFEQDGIIKIVYFKDGDVLSASTNDRKDAVDEILLRAGKVGREHIKQALAKRQENETLGDALLNLGFITRKELTWARRVQVIGIVRSVRAWTEGSYAIVADYLPKRDEGTVFSLPQILVEFIVTEQDRTPFERAMDSGEAVFHRAANFDAEFAKLDLNEDAAEIAAQIDGAKSAAEIANVTGKDAFNVYKLLEALRRLGLIDKGAADMGAVAAEPTEGMPSFQFDDAPAAELGVNIAPLPADDLSFESAGVADAADAFSSPPPEPKTSFAEPEAVAAAPSLSFENEPPKVPFALSLNEAAAAPPPPPEPVVPAPPIAPIEIPETPIEEPAWGFDEAQIEAARKATGERPMPRSTPTLTNVRRPPLTRPQPKKKRSGAAMYAVIVVLLVAGVVGGGWMWWQTQNPPPAPVAVARPAKRPVIPATTSGAPAPLPASLPATTTTAPPMTATTASIAPAPVPVPQPAPAPAPVAPTPAPASGDKYVEMARNYAKNPGGNFTIQFELVCQTSSLQKAIAGGGDNVWFVPVTYKNQSCYRVFWGRYNARDEAAAALGRIPAALHGSTPVVVAVPKS